MQLSLVIPCYNEEACIEEVTAAWIEEIRKRADDFEMVLVDDGSTDRTPEILADLASKYPELRVVRQVNRGHGPALLKGYWEAKGEWVFHTDSDDQFFAEDFWNLWDRKGEGPYLMARRLERKDPLHRLWLSKALNLFVRFVLRVPVQDINIPYKLIRRDLLERLLGSIPDSTYTPSVLLALGAVRNNVVPVEIGVRHLPRTTGETVLKPWRLTRFCARALAQLLHFGLTYWPREPFGRTRA